MLRLPLVLVLLLSACSSTTVYNEYKIEYGASSDALDKSLVTYCDTGIYNCSSEPKERIGDYYCLVDNKLYYRKYQEDPLMPLNLYCKSLKPVTVVD